MTTRELYDIKIMNCTKWFHTNGQCRGHLKKNHLGIKQGDALTHIPTSSLYMVNVKVFFFFCARCTHLVFVRVI